MNGTLDSSERKRAMQSCGEMDIGAVVDAVGSFAFDGEDA